MGWELPNVWRQGHGRIYVLCKCVALNLYAADLLLHNQSVLCVLAEGALIRADSPNTCAKVQKHTPTIVGLLYVVKRSSPDTNTNLASNNIFYNDSL